MPPQKAPDPFLPPPLIFAGVFLAACLADFAWPLRFLPSGWNRIPAVLLLLGGVVIFIAAVTALRKARTPLSPYEPAKALQTAGPYLRARNPIYLAFAWIYLGFACWIDSLWPLLFFPVLIYVVTRFVIAREEAHLEERFGGRYRDYRARARRWM